MVLGCERSTAFNSIVGLHHHPASFGSSTPPTALYVLVHTTFGLESLVVMHTASLIITRLLFIVSPQEDSGTRQTMISATAAIRGVSILHRR